MHDPAYPYSSRSVEAAAEKLLDGGRGVFFAVNGDQARPLMGTVG
jgi:hypothetical protein